MIIGAQLMVPQYLTVATINAGIVALNTRLAGVTGYTATDQLPTGGVVDMAGTTFLDLPRPCIGYMVGVLKEGATELKRQGKSRMILPLWVDYVCKQNATLAAAQQAAAVTAQAVLYALEAMEGQQLAGVTGLPIGCVLIGPNVSMEIVLVDIAAAGKLFGFRTRYDLTFDDVRN